MSTNPTGFIGPNLRVSTPLLAKTSIGKQLSKNLAFFSNSLSSIFGAFINIFPGVEALLPVSEMSDENVNPFNEFKVGDSVEVLIKKFTPQEHRIALSTKDISKNA